MPGTDSPARPSRPTFESEDMEDVVQTPGPNEVEERGFTSKLATDIMKSHISGGKQNQESSNPLGSALSSLLGEKTDQKKHDNGNDIGGIISSVLGGKPAQEQKHSSAGA